MPRLISHRVRLSLIFYSSTSQNKCLQIPCIILSLKGNIIWTQSQIIWTFSVLPFMSLSLAFISFAKKVAIGYCSHWIYKIKSGRHRARLREKHLSRYQAQFVGNLLRCVRARAHLRALMTQKSCAVGMRYAKLRNHLKSPSILDKFNAKPRENVSCVCYCVFN